MPNLFEVIENRRSIRKFRNNEIPRENIKTIIEAGMWAPSASNKQMWKFIAVTNNDIKDRMSKAVGDKIDQLAQQYQITNDIEKWKKFSTFFNEAPAVIAVLHEPYVSGKWQEALEKGLTYEEMLRLRAEPGLQSIGGAVQNILLAAEAMGYGACWMTAPVVAAHEIEGLLGVESPWQLAALIPIGKPHKVPEAKSRKPIEETITFLE